MYPLGRVPSRPDDRDYPFSRFAAVVTSFPPQFIPNVLPPVLDQGQTPQCVGYSGAALRTLQEIEDEKRVLAFDASELYARCKENDGYPTGDGTEIRIAAEVLRSRGAAVSGSPDPVEIGKFRPISAYARLKTRDEIKSTILMDGAAWIGVDWYDAWFTPEANGDLPLPDSIAGGHALLIVGWDDKRNGGSWYIQNNWGESWGLGGRAWIKYAFLNFSGSNEAWRTVDVIDAPVPDPQPTPPPTPDPVPAPTPSPTPETADELLADAVRDWAAKRHARAAREVAQAIRVWIKAKGL